MRMEHKMVKAEKSARQHCTCGVPTLQSEEMNCEPEVAKGGRRVTESKRRMMEKLRAWWGTNKSNSP
jgi:hypothetical protein